MERKSLQVTGLKVYLSFAHDLFAWPTLIVAFDLANGPVMHMELGLLLSLFYR